MTLYDDSEYEPYDPDDGEEPEAEEPQCNPDECEMDCEGCPSIADDPLNFLARVQCFAHRLAEEVVANSDHSQIETPGTPALTDARLTVAKYLLCAASELLYDTVRADLEAFGLDDVTVEDIDESLDLKERELFALLDALVGSNYGSAGRWLETEVAKIAERERRQADETTVQQRSLADSMTKVNLN